MINECNDYFKDCTAEQDNSFQASNAVSSDTLGILTCIGDTITDDRQHITNFTEANSTLSTSDAAMKEEIKTLQGQIKISCRR